MSTNPFTYGKPITNPARFVGRRREIEKVQSRLRNTEFESSSIVGERRIGKTSLLKYLSHPDVTRQAGFPQEKYIFIYLDLQLLDVTSTPTYFWQHVLRTIKPRVNNEVFQASIDEICQKQSIDTFLLDSLFRLVDDLNLHIVFLLDEFENVCQNKSFEVDFFNGLRALTIHHNLALITSSRRELVDLTLSKAVKASPFFNIFANINLRPFSEGEAETLIETYLAGNEVSFRGRDIGYILEIAGLHPHFLQMACSFLYEAYRRTDDVQLRRRFLNADFREEAASLFRDYWHHSTADQRVLLTVMSLLHLEQVERRDSDTKGDTLEQLKQFYSGVERTLPALEKRGLVLAEAGETTHYRPFSLVFCDWVADELKAGIDGEAVWNRWKAKQRERLKKLPTEARRRVLDLSSRLNSACADSIGNWLLNPSTVNSAVSLLENFLDDYQKYMSRRPVAPTTDPLLASGSMTKSSSRSTEDSTRIQHLHGQLEIYQRNLNSLEVRGAQHSILNIPLALQNEIEATKRKIAEIKQELEDLNRAQ